MTAPPGKGKGGRRRRTGPPAFRVRDLRGGAGVLRRAGLAPTATRGRRVLSRPLAVAASLESHLRGTTGIVTGPSEKCGRREAKWQDRGPPAFPRRAVAPAGPDASQLAGENLAGSDSWGKRLS